MNMMKNEVQNVMAVKVLCVLINTFTQQKEIIWLHKMDSNYKLVSALNVF
jgi:hypothetical protein